MSLNNFIDGLIDGMMRAGDITQKEWEIKQLEDQNFRLGKECGTCYHWMTRKCPRETKTNKVSCGQPICSEYQMQSHYIKLISTNEDKILDKMIELETLKNQ